MGVDSGALIKTLNRACLSALQKAAALCRSRTNHAVEIEHWLLELIESRDGDLARIFREFDVDASRLGRDLNRVIDGLPGGNQRTPTLSLRIDELIRSAWVLSSVQFQARQVRSAVLLLALLEHKELGRLARDASRELARIKTEVLTNNLAKLVVGSAEDDAAPAATEPAPASSPADSDGPVSQTPALDQYTVNLTERAAAGRIDPIIGREAEIRQMLDILVRRRQNNPILTGEAGVGKTAVVEGLALRIAQGDVPPALRNVQLRTLDLGLLQAGAGIRGEFENRLKQVLSEVKASPVPIILFIDEAHTMIGAGATPGQSDAANLLKPALARGELRTIAATTWAEYKKYFEKDAALARRFQTVKVDEPDEESAIRMLRGLTGILEKHHGVRILEESITTAVKLSHRYMPGRQLPDKAVGLLDTACARVAIGQNATPARVEDARRVVDHIKLELEILEREQATGARVDERIAAKQADLARSETLVAKLVERWDDERKRALEIQALTQAIEAQYAGEKQKAVDGGLPFQPSARLTDQRNDLEGRKRELLQAQADDPLVQVSVEPRTVADVVAGWTGIPVRKMMADEIHSVLNLKSKLEERVIGQSHALEVICRRIVTSRASLTDPRKPVGVFLLVGPSGVGKTETALSLADSIYGGERDLITINMSEYQEAHTVSGLKGSPPGYVGFGEGGVLTEAVRRRPHSVVLLDEVEKAHPDVLELFFQVFDKGTLEDGEGREVDFKNTLILLTSNVGTDTIMALCADPKTTPESDALAAAIRPDLLAAKTERGTPIFKEAFLGRLIVVPYKPISDDVMRRIIRLQLDRIAGRMRDSHNAQLTYRDDVVDCIANRCREVESGARNVDQILTNTLLPQISQEILARMGRGETLSRVHVSVGDKTGFDYALE
jgi:type VI secretion system protein VasG